MCAGDRQPPPAKPSRASFLRVRAGTSTTGRDPGHHFSTLPGLAWRPDHPFLRLNLHPASLCPSSCDFCFRVTFYAALKPRNPPAFPRTPPVESVWPCLLPVSRFRFFSSAASSISTPILLDIASSNLSPLPRILERRLLPLPPLFGPDLNTSSPTTQRHVRSLIDACAASADPRAQLFSNSAVTLRSSIFSHPKWPSPECNR